MRLAYSTFQRPDKVTFHEVRERKRDNQHRDRAQTVTWCGIALAGGWKVGELDREPTCGRCEWVKRMKAEHEEAA